MLAGGRSLDSDTPPDRSLGTLWCVKESLWKEVVPHYDQLSRREKHFGVSTLRMPLPSRSVGLVPMLHGSSEDAARREVEFMARTSPATPRRRLFYACGLSEEGGEEYRTYFGHLRPAQLPTWEISSDPAPGQDDLDLGWAYDCLRIRPNDHKRRLSPIERGCLVNWLKQNNLW